MRLVGQWKPGTPESSGHRVPLRSAPARSGRRGAGRDGHHPYHRHHRLGQLLRGHPEQVEAVIAATGADAVEMEGTAVAHVAARKRRARTGHPRAERQTPTPTTREFRTFDITEYANTAARLAVNIVRRL